MSKAVKKRDIVVLEPSSKKLYKLSDNILSEITVKEKSNSSYNLSYMRGDNVMYASVEIPNDSKDDEVSIITNKAYEILGLDIEKGYKISYSISNASVGINTVYNVFVVEDEKIDSEFKDVANKMQYIDYIDMEPLLYQNYYSNKLIDSAGIQVFIYFHKTYTTLTVYKDGELVNYKILNMISIDKVYGEYVRDLGERIPEHIFISDLNKYGFDNPDNIKRVSLNTIFCNYFRFVGSNLELILRGLSRDSEQITKVFVGTDIGFSQNFLQKVEVFFGCFNSPEENKLDKLLENVIESNQDSCVVGEFINIHKIRYDLFKNVKNFIVENNNNSDFTNMPEKDSPELKINPFVLLCLLRGNEQLKLPSDIFNISPYLRPPPFLQRYSGKLLLSVLVVAVLSSIYPLYNVITNFFITQEIDKIVESLPEKEGVYKKVDSEIKALNEKIAGVEQEVSDEKNKRDYRYRLLDNIYNKKVNYLSKAKVFVDIGNILNSTNIKVTKLEIDKDRISLLLKGSSTGMTSFLKEIGNNDNYIIESKEVLISILDKNNKLKEYESNIVIRVLK
ncbi:hypothetical protein [Campylobacter sp. MG1]|uniref:hypothetical protein n=1 Tax=Campylobacter sp. MG1 TaxID=2976332 RepID=UPI00226CD781|nr:hypothetical protein [Campylobacter sp. MG1]